MLKIINMTPDGFKNYAKTKKVYVFGAGRALHSCLDIYFPGLEVAGIVDNSKNLWGKRVIHNKRQIEIIGVKKFVTEVRNCIEECILMITSPFYAAEIVEQLDQIPQLDQLECFLQVLVRNTKESNGRFEFTKGPNKIPKRIHYIWVGGKPLPYKYEKNIETWRRWNPDYEIIRWDETNYDFTKVDYVREAYETNNWGFVPNYVRLDIIYQHGGIYLDTDVEAINNFDCLLNDEAFLCMGCADRINNGCGFGAVAGCQLIYDLREQFRLTHFLDEKGLPGRKACHSFVHPVVKRYGFSIQNNYQNTNGIALYPTEVMSPLAIEGLPDNLTDKTVSIHYENGSWKNEKEKEGLIKLRRLIDERLVTVHNGGKA